MSLARIWTALLAGSCVAFVSTLLCAATLALLAYPPIDRQALYDVFLIAWLLMSLALAIPARPLTQWLAAVRVAAVLFGVLCIVSLATSREPAMLAVTVMSAGLLTLLSFGLTGGPVRHRAER